MLLNVYDVSQGDGKGTVVRLNNLVGPKGLGLGGALLLQPAACRSREAWRQGMRPACTLLLAVQGLTCTVQVLVEQLHMQPLTMPGTLLLCWLLCVQGCSTVLLCWGLWSSPLGSVSRALASTQSRWAAHGTCFSQALAARLAR